MIIDQNIVIFKIPPSPATIMAVSKKHQLFWSKKPVLIKSGRRKYCCILLYTTVLLLATVLKYCSHYNKYTVGIGSSHSSMLQSPREQFVYIIIIEVVVVIVD